MKVLLANPRGFCAGVDRAIEIVERAILRYGAPIYVRHEVVHNRFVVGYLKDKGAIFVEEIEDIPKGAVVVFSAHGVSRAVKAMAQEREVIIFDATCPLVTKVHKEVIRSQKKAEQMILIGHAGHPEVEGTLGQYNDTKNIYLVETPADVETLNIDKQKPISYTTQTTLSVDDTIHIVYALKAKYPNIRAPNKSDICYATQNRQNAVKAIMNSSDILLVLGSANSSNSNRLREIALKQRKPAYLIDDANEINSTWLKNINTVGVTAGASAPEILVQNVISYLKYLGASQVIEVDAEKENITFPLPKTLR